MKKITIRKTTIDDIEQTVKLSNVVWRITYAHILPQEIFDERDAKTEEKILKAKKTGVNVNGRVDYVALDGGKVVAFVAGKTESDYEYYKGYADLMAIYIDPAYQHLGIGKKLFDKVAAFFKNQGFKRMVIGVLKENHQARKAYEKWGGKLDNYEMPFVRLDCTTTEVFYIYNLL